MSLEELLYVDNQRRRLQGSQVIWRSTNGLRYIHNSLASSGINRHWCPPSSPERTHPLTFFTFILFSSRYSPFLGFLKYILASDLLLSLFFSPSPPLSSTSLFIIHIMAAEWSVLLLAGGEVSIRQAKQIRFFFSPLREFLFHVPLSFWERDPYLESNVKY